ncbi:hypothetical protein D3C87_2203280 [compost metagenome]
MNGRSWTAHKRIPPAETLRQELMAAGFEIIEEELEILPGNNPALLKLVLAPKV